METSRNPSGISYEQFQKLVTELELDKGKGPLPPPIKKETSKIGPGTSLDLEMAPWPASCGFHGPRCTFAYFSSRRGRREQPAVGNGPLGTTWHSDHLGPTGSHFCLYQLLLHLGSGSGAMATTLHGLLEASALRRPKHVCLLYGDGPGMTYEEVWAAVERCAGHLAVLQDPVLAVVADRSYGLVICLLGTLRAGKAYTPIEPDFPVSRAQAMLETADVRHALVPVQQVPQPLLHDLAPWR